MLVLDTQDSTFRIVVASSPLGILMNGHRKPDTSAKPPKIHVFPSAHDFGSDSAKVIPFLFPAQLEFYTEFYSLHTRRPCTCAKSVRLKSVLMIHELVNRTRAMLS